jgi:putative flippase GtrA
MSRVARFLWVGAGGFVAQLMTLQGLVTLGGVATPLATALAVEAAILHNFLWHERWTWVDRRTSGGRLARFLRFNGVTALVSIAGNVAVTAWLVGTLHLPLVVANTLAVLALAVVNFAVADRVVFTEPARSLNSSAPGPLVPQASRRVELHF